jgi:hypothetical protein
MSFSTAARIVALTTAVVARARYPERALRDRSDAVVLVCSVESLTLVTEEPQA